MHRLSSLLLVGFVACSSTPDERPLAVDVSAGAQVEEPPDDEGRETSDTFARGLETIFRTFRPLDGWSDKSEGACS